MRSAMLILQLSLLRWMSQTHAVQFSSHAIEHNYP